MEIQHGVIKVKIETVGREIDYGKSDISHTMRILTAKDEEGHKYNAMAFGKVTKDLSVGKDIFVTKSRSPNPHASSNIYFVLKTV